ncbi:unnamed protein product [Blepharisma stoltei]|uniref:Uncharacterized protein n=1 Tax=Blepharisma stoltei TaxID=1481888 RepID=A0AAU9ISJ5_9CILI|nr:unnamed protein product [Blepharisma stoltei]
MGQYNHIIIQTIKLSVLQKTRKNSRGICLFRLKNLLCQKSWISHLGMLRLKSKVHLQILMERRGEDLF